MKKVFFIVVLFATKAHAASLQSCTRFPQTAAALSGINKSWNNPSNALSEDGVFASTTASANILQLTNFNFVSCVPPNATIAGIQVDIKEQGVSFVIDNQVILYNADGSSTSSNLAALIDWPTTLSYISYGGPTNVWGLSPTPALINSINFGLGVSNTKDSGGIQTCNIDVGRMTVYFYTQTTLNNATINNGTLR